MTMRLQFCQRQYTASRKGLVLVSGSAVDLRVQPAGEVKSCLREELTEV